MVRRPAPPQCAVQPPDSSAALEEEKEEEEELLDNAAALEEDQAGDADGGMMAWCSAPAAAADPGHPDLIGPQQPRGCLTKGGSCSPRDVRAVEEVLPPVLITASATVQGGGWWPGEGDAGMCDPPPCRAEDVQAAEEDSQQGAPAAQLPVQAAARSAWLSDFVEEADALANCDDLEDEGW
jgi:hypothetical protein